MASLDGRCSSGADGYLRNTPAGCRSYSANRHATSESDSVRQNPKFFQARVFAVPTEVSASGSTEMLAHFKIAQSGLVSPRLHYHDDSARTQKVYVGYIGPHLPTKNSN
jgi:hypothetical protein